jgi:cell division protein FtsB
MRRQPWLVVSLLAVVGVLVLGAFPTRAYLDQLEQRRELADRVQTLGTANEELTAQVEHLRTDEAVERLARERYQLVRPGEEAYTILPQATPDAAPASIAPTAAPESRPSWLSRAWTKVTSIF